MTIGKRITKFRKEQKLSQEKLSEKLSITRQTLSNYENDITIPDIETANKIAKILNISLDELLGNDLSFIENKLNSNEKLTRKNSKLLKILLITIYFVVLISLIYIMVYYLNKRDFTGKYQAEIICHITEQEYTEYIKLVLDEQSYSCIGGETKTCNKDNTSCEVTCDESKRIYYYTINAYGKAVYSKDAYKTKGENFKPSDEVHGEKIFGGYSIKDAYDSLYTIKSLLITQGYTCK